MLGWGRILAETFYMISRKTMCSPHTLASSCVQYTYRLKWYNLDLNNGHAFTSTIFSSGRIGAILMHRYASKLLWSVTLSLCWSATLHVVECNPQLAAMATPHYSMFFFPFETTPATHNLHITENSIGFIGTWHGYLEQLRIPFVVVLKYFILFLNQWILYITFFVQVFLTCTSKMNENLYIVYWKFLLLGCKAPHFPFFLSCHFTFHSVACQ